MMIKTAFCKISGRSRGWPIQITFNEQYYSGEGYDDDQTAFKSNRGRSRERPGQAMFN